MKYGMFSNSARIPGSATADYQADLDEIVLADRLGYSEAWVSEHLGSSLEGAMSAPELLIAKAAGLTTDIRLGSGVRLLPLFHPYDVATQAAVNDHLTNGRYNLGIGTGFPLLANYERRGLRPEERVPRTLESLDFIMKCFTSEEPFDFEGEFYSGREVSVLPRSLQRPYPPISVASSSHLMPFAAEGGHGLIIGHMESTSAARARIDEYVGLAEAVGLAQPREQVRLARLIFVAESSAEARQAMKGMVDDELTWRRAWGAGGKRVPNPYVSFAQGDETFGDMSFELLMDRGAFIVGDPDEVVSGIRGLTDQVGGFGTIVYVSGKNFGSIAQQRASITLFATEVAPRLTNPAKSPVEVGR